MPRRPRVHLLGQPLHIVQCGHNREACFFAEEDYHACLHWLGEALTATGVQLHAYARMSNHVQFINRGYRSTGTKPPGEALPPTLFGLHF